MPIQNIQGIPRIAKQMEPDIAKAFVLTIQQIKDATAISRIEENTVAGNAVHALEKTAMGQRSLFRK